MRVADKNAFNQVNNNISKNRTDMAELQHQAATQKRINKPSDDPLASTRVLAARTDERIQTQFTKSLNIAKGFLEITDQTLGELTEALTRAKELAISQSNDASANEESRRVVGTEVEQILFQAVQLGNRKLGDRYIFSGHRTTVAPFDNKGNYRGDDDDIKIQVNKDTFIPMNLPGSKLFLGKGLNPDGVARGDSEVPRTVDQLREYRTGKEEQSERQKEVELPEQVFTNKGRGLASVPVDSQGQEDVDVAKGVNVFNSLKTLEIAMKTNDKQGIQEGLEMLDGAINQVVLARSQVGSRVMSINSTLEGMQKSIVDAKATASSLEDADIFQVVSDINKTESALKATLETSGKLVQPSLMDFLR